MISTSTISEAKPAVAPLLFLGGSKSQPVWIDLNLNKQTNRCPNQGPVSHSPKIQPSSIPAQPYIKMVIWCVTQVLRVKAAQRKCRRRSWQLGPCSCVPGLLLYIIYYFIFICRCVPGSSSTLSAVEEEHVLFDQKTILDKVEVM